MEFGSKAHRSANGLNSCGITLVYDTPLGPEYKICLRGCRMSRHGSAKYLNMLAQVPIVARRPLRFRGERLHKIATV